MSNSFFADEDQLSKWVEAAEGIEEEFGIDKALSYLIGEKFYNVVCIFRSAREIIRSIEGQRKKPDYNPIREFGGKEHKFTTNLDEVFREEMKKLDVEEEVLTEFASLINSSFGPHEIRGYFDSHPRLGALGHVYSEEEHKFMVEKGAVEHSLDTEVEDALIFGEMMKYLGVKIRNL